MIGRTLVLTLSALAVISCDSLLGPAAPASVEINASRARLDALGDTVMLEAVVRDDRSKPLPGAAVSWESRSPDVAPIGPDGILTAVSDGTTRVVARSDGMTDSLDVIVEAVIPCAPVGELMVGDTLAGSIADGDCVLEGGGGDFWRVTLEEEIEVTFEMRSPELDAVLVLFDSRGELIAVDDDGGIGLNSRIFRALPAGTYFLFTTQTRRDQRGSYKLSAHEGGIPSSCPATGSIGLPDSVTGTVTAEACNFNNGFYIFYIDVWRLSLDTDTTVILQLSSDELMPGMQVTDTLGNALAGSTIGPGSDALIEIPLNAGSYDIWVGDGVNPRRTGSYTLSTRMGPSLLTCETEGPIAVGDTVSGDLAPDDCFLFGGAADAWDLELDDSVTLDLTVRAADLAPSLLVSDATGELLAAREGDADLVQEELTLGPGSYRVWARAPFGRHGDYDLTVTVSETVAGRLPSWEPVGSLAPAPDRAPAWGNDTGPRTEKSADPAMGVPRIIRHP